MLISLLFVPKQFMFEAEEKNAEGFAKEGCNVVTHYRLKNDEKNPGKLIVDEKAKLEEELIVRPTSEAIIWNTYKNWIQSYRDLPILINQWANVVRWEMRTRLFLRTAEFLWQEGHTAHSTKQEAIEEAEQMNNIYAEFAQNFMGIPVIKGLKSESERFAGAEETYCIEALMQDGKALQAGTSHFLGQNFAKAFDVKFATKEGKQELVWGNFLGSFNQVNGCSGKGSMYLDAPWYYLQNYSRFVMYSSFHLHDEGLAKVMEVAKRIEEELKAEGVTVKLDDDDNRKPGWKFAEYEMKGVPLRIAIGPRDVENNVVELARRDIQEKSSVSQEGIAKHISSLLDEIQEAIYTLISKL